MTYIIEFRTSFFIEINSVWSRYHFKLIEVCFLYPKSFIFSEIIRTWLNMSIIWWIYVELHSLIASRSSVFTFYFLRLNSFFLSLFRRPWKFYRLRSIKINFYKLNFIDFFSCLFFLFDTAHVAMDFFIIF